MDLNKWAEEITAMEGGKLSISNAQVKEVVKCHNVLLYRRFAHNAMAGLQFFLGLLLNGKANDIAMKGEVDKTEGMKKIRAKKAMHKKEAKARSKGEA